MKKVIAKEGSGYCMGVRRAMNIVLDAAGKEEGSVTTFGPIIHNPEAVESLNSKDVRVVNQISELNSNGTVIVRAHGIGPDVRQELKSTGLTIRDATCPLVSKVHSSIRRYLKRGHHLIIVGEEKHPEVIGHLGFARGQGTVISKIEDVDKLPNFEKVCVVAQTTFDEQYFLQIAGALRKRYGVCDVVNTICFETLNRQREVRELAQEVDAMVIIGGKNSGNTRRLAQISESYGIPAFFVETEKEIRLDELEKFETVGITAGASTPNWLIQKVIDHIDALEHLHEPLWLQGLRRMTTSLFRLSFFVALGAALLTLGSALLQEIQPKPVYPLIAILYTLSMFILNRCLDKEADKFNEPARTEFYERHARPLLGTGMAAGIAALALTFPLGPLPFACLLVFSLTGVLYSVRFIPYQWQKVLGIRRPKDILASKSFFIPIACAVVMVFIPYLSSDSGSLPATLVTSLFVFTVVFLRTALLDMSDIERDRIAGSEILTMLIEKPATLRLLWCMLGSMAVIIVGSALLGWVSPLAFAMLAALAYSALTLYLYQRKVVFKGLTFLLMVDGNLIVAGLLAYLGALVLV